MSLVYEKGLYHYDIAQMAGQGQAARRLAHAKRSSLNNGEVANCSRRYHDRNYRPHDLHSFMPLCRYQGLSVE